MFWGLFMGKSMFNFLVFTIHPSVVATLLNDHPPPKTLNDFPCSMALPMSACMEAVVARYRSTILPVSPLATSNKLFIGCLKVSCRLVHTLRLVCVICGCAAIYKLNKFFTTRHLQPGRACGISTLLLQS